MLVSIKELSQRWRISYEAARQQVQRYTPDLGDHVIRQGRRTLLDEEAVKILEERRKGSVVIVEKNDGREMIDALTAENDSLKAKVFELQEKLIQMQDEKTRLIEKAGRADLLLEDRERQAKELEGQRAEIAQLTADLETARKEVAEAGKYTKTLFGFYRKKEQ